MIEKVYCEKCGSEMISIDNKKPIGMNCPNCGWGWASSYINEIDLDEKIYEIILLEGNEISNATVRAISIVTNTNYLNSRKILMKGDSTLIQGNARQIKEFASILETNNIKYKIVPEYPY